jgi:cation transport ATPase
VYLATPDRIIAPFAVADIIRPESRAAIKELSGLGIEVAILALPSNPPA